MPSGRLRYQHLLFQENSGEGTNLKINLPLPAFRPSSSSSSSSSLSLSFHLCVPLRLYLHALLLASICDALAAMLSARPHWGQTTPPPWWARKRRLLLSTLRHSAPPLQRQQPREHCWLARRSDVHRGRNQPEVFLHKVFPNPGRPDPNPGTSRPLPV